jgi:hypothetical protein
MSVDEQNMATSDPATEDLIGIFEDALRRHWRTIFRWTAALTLLVAGAGAIRFWTQPSAWTSSIRFQATFAGAQLGQYPNGLPFVRTDFIAPSVLDAAFDQNHVERYCARDDFRRGFHLDTTATSPPQFDLTFAPLGTCSRVPKSIANEAVAAVLPTWASDAKSKRGAFEPPVPMPTSAGFDAAADSRDLSTKIARVHSAFVQAFSDVRDVEKMPKADAVRYGPGRTTLRDVEARLQGVLSERLPAALSSAGPIVPEAIRAKKDFEKEALTNLQEAREQAQIYASALREYSAALPRPAEAADSGGQPGVERPTLQPDQAVLDRIIQLSAPYQTYRQALTQGYIDQSIAALAFQKQVDRYRSPADGVGADAAGSRRRLDEALQLLIAEGRASMNEVGALYNELRRVTLDDSLPMYFIDRDAAVEIARAFAARQFVILVMATFIVVSFVALLACAARDRLFGRSTSDAKPMAGGRAS